MERQTLVVGFLSLVKDHKLFHLLVLDSGFSFGCVYPESSAFGTALDVRIRFRTVPEFTSPEQRPGFSDGPEFALFGPRQSSITRSLLLSQPNFLRQMS